MIAKPDPEPERGRWRGPRRKFGRIRQKGSTRGFDTAMARDAVVSSPLPPPLVPLIGKSKAVAVKHAGC